MSTTLLSRSEHLAPRRVAARVPVHKTWDVPTYRAYDLGLGPARSSDDRAALDRRSGREGRRKQGKKGEAAGFRTTPGTEEEEERCVRRAPGHLRNNCTYKMKIYLFSPLILCVLKRWSQLSGSRGVTTGCQGFGEVGDATGGRSQKRTQARTQAARAFRPSATSEFLPTPHHPMTTNPSQRH